MVYVKSNRITNVLSRLTYVFDDSAHDNSDHRVLSTIGENVHLWGMDGHAYRSQSGYFLSRQFAATRAKAKNTNKPHQAQHLILSFSDDEFDTANDDELINKADQINKLVKGFMAQHFGDQVQWTSGVQCDGHGHKLHSHLIINSVDVNGKTVPTNKFTVGVLRKQWNQYLERNFARVTGRTYHNPFDKPVKNPKVNHQHGWQHDLEQTLANTRTQSDSLGAYVDSLKTQGVTITERNKSGDWSYHVTVNGKQKTVRDFYQRKNKKTGAVKSTRGIGKDYTPDALKQYFEFKNNQKECDNHGNTQAAAGESVSTDHGQRYASDQQRQLNALAERIQRSQYNQLSDDLDDAINDQSGPDEQSTQQGGPEVSH